METFGRAMRVPGALLAALCLLVACAGPASPNREPAGPVTIEFWTWAAGMDEIVAVWNEENPDIQVELGAVDSGTAYAKLRAAVQSGTGPDLAHIAYEQIPSFATEGHLQDVSELAAQYEQNYIPWTWRSAGFLDQHYGIPDDVGPMMMYYNKAVFESQGVEVPETWEEYAAAAATFQESDVTMAYFINNGATMAALAWQKGSRWFAIEGESWRIAIDDEDTQDVVSYWSALADSGQVTMDPGFNPGFWHALDSGEVATLLIGAWGYRGMKGNLEATAGDWAVAPLPQWADADAPAGGNHGGSTWAVMKGSEHPEQALKFANWLASSEQGMNLQAQYVGYFPSAVDGDQVSALFEPDDFFGGQALGPVIQEAAGTVDVEWQWGPNMPTVFSSLTDGMGAATSEQAWRSVLDETQRKTVADLKSRGISVQE